MIFLDTNIFLRFFLRENELVVRNIEKLFYEIISDRITGISNVLVIAEIVWVLESTYKWGKEKICDNIEFILNTPNIKFKERTIIVHAVNIYKKENIDFIDAYNFSYMKYYGINKIYSFDKDFDKLEDIKRIEP
jgi:predicted nucleic-acid-binding protein